MILLDKQCSDNRGCTVLSYLVVDPFSWSEPNARYCWQCYKRLLDSLLQLGGRNYTKNCSCWGVNIEAKTTFCTISGDQLFRNMVRPWPDQPDQMLQPWVWKQLNSAQPSPGAHSLQVESGCTPNRIKIPDSPKSAIISIMKVCPLGAQGVLQTECEHENCKYLETRNGFPESSVRESCAGQ